MRRARHQTTRRPRAPAGFVVRYARISCKRFPTLAGGQEKPLLVPGIKPGTSLNTADYAVCKIGSGRVRLLRHWQTKFPRHWREWLHAAATNQATRYEPNAMKF